MSCVNFTRDGAAVLLSLADGRASAEVQLHGGHVSSFRVQGIETLFVSQKAEFARGEGGRALRGGIPICWPQFGPLSAEEGSEALPQHGFARTAEWELWDATAEKIDVSCSGTAGDFPGTSLNDMALGDASATFRLTGERKEWPDRRFEFFMRVVVRDDHVSPMLVTALGVKNIGNRDLVFSTALHTYFAVDSIENAAVVGLGRLRYRDNATGRYVPASDNEPEDIIFEGEVDRVVMGTPDTVHVRGAVGGRTVVLKKESLPDAVVWNPWIEKAHATADLSDDDWKRFVCVESAAIEHAVRVTPGRSWTGSATFSFLEES